MYHRFFKTLLYFVLFIPFYSITAEEKTYIDEYHASISNTVLEWSKKIDDGICDTFGDGNVTCDINTQQTSASLDAFFQTDKYLSETQNTYVRFRIGEYLQSKESNDFKVRLSVQLPLSRTKKNFQIFMEDVEAKDVDNAVNNSLNKENTSANFGINYSAPDIDKFQSKYYLGFSGIYPYLGARYNLFMNTEEWDVDILQKFQYASNNVFEEETNVYFDNYYDEKSFFRIQLHRRTITEKSGMDYGLILQYFNNPSRNKGLQSTIAFLGNTKYYPEDIEEYNSSNRDSYAGINNYYASLSWRENIWRKWFYYEVRPAVNFHKKHDYKANYSVLIMFDFYFGRYN